MDVADLETGGGGSEGIGALLQSVNAGGVALWGSDAGPDPTDGADPDKLPAQVCATSHQEAAKVAGGGELEIFSTGDSNGGIGIRIYRGLSHEEAEYGRAIYCDATDSGPL